MIRALTFPESFVMNLLSWVVLSVLVMWLWLTLPLRMFSVMPVVKSLLVTKRPREMQLTWPRYVWWPVVARGALLTATLFLAGLQSFSSRPKSAAPFVFDVLWTLTCLFPWTESARLWKSLRLLLVKWKLRPWMVTLRLKDSTLDVYVLDALLVEMDPADPVA